jgi:hypothetical protein
MVLITIALLVYFWRRGWIFQRNPEIEIKPPPAEDFDDERGL